MTRTDGTGRCEHCEYRFPFQLIHHGFNDSTHAYCDRCGMTAIISLGEVGSRLGRIPARLTPLPSEIGQLLARCSCGGTFAGHAPARCPSCRRPLSAWRAADWFESGGSWKWQRSWSGLYALILDGGVAFDPFIEPAPH